MKHKILALGFCAALLLCGCNKEDPTATTVAAATPAGESLEEIKPQELFSDRDYEVGYDDDKSAHISLKGSSASADSNAVKLDGSTVTITDEGTYVLSGQLSGMVIVNADKQDKVQLVLQNADITSATSAAIYILQADKVFLTLVGENRLENGGSFVAIDDSNIDAALFSKEDLTMNGEGSLSVVSPAGHGVVSKDELTITGGSYAVSCASHALCGKDSVAIAAGSFTLAAGKDGIHSENDEDAALGLVYIADGEFFITAEGDGISAGTEMQIDGGSYEIVTGGGAVNGQKPTSENWGGMPGGGGHGGGRPGGGGGMGGRPGGQGGQSGNTQTTTEDSTSIKGVKAGSSLLINKGTFKVDSADDAFHANGVLKVVGGDFTIATGDDAFHADQALTIAGGNITVSESYEGFEGLSVTVSGGKHSLICSDDGLNAAGGTDGSGMGGNRGGDRFGGHGGNADSFIKITGGELYLRASGDGIDSNGTLEISGGFTTVCGPTQGDTAVLDYEMTGVITGGTFIGTGSYMMAQTFSNSGQGVIALSVGSQSANVRITLSDAQGNVLVDYTPALSYAIVILSTPEIVKGETYTVTVGDLTGEFEAG